MEKTLVKNDSVSNSIHHQKIGYSVAELSQLVGVSQRKLWSEIREKKSLRAAKIGARVVISAAAVDEWLANAEN